MGVGLVMFLKAMVVAIAVAIWDAWLVLKKRKMMNLRQDPKTGRYVPDYRWQRVEDWARRIFWTAFIIFNIFAVFVTAVFLGYWPG